MMPWIKGGDQRQNLCFQHKNVLGIAFWKKPGNRLRMMSGSDLEHICYLMKGTCSLVLCDAEVMSLLASTRFLL